MSVIFSDSKISEELDALDHTWLAAPHRNAYEVFRAICGPHIDVVAYSYSPSVQAITMTCLATYRVVLIDSEHWHDKALPDPARTRADQVRDGLAQSTEAGNLLTVAASFAEPGYLDRLDSEQVSHADLFVVALVHRWFHERALAGDMWSTENAKALAGLVDASAVVPYLEDAFAWVGSRAA